MTVEKHTPGSREAQEAGCLCPVLDNNHGRFAPYPPDGWWLHEDCPYHLPARPWTHLRHSVDSEPLCGSEDAPAALTNDLEAVTCPDCLEAFE